MRGFLELSLRLAGVGLIVLAWAHLPMARRLKWGDESRRMSAVNASIFQVHALFIAVMLVIMGLPCLLAPDVWLEPSRAGAWWSWSFAGFWAIRCYCQWFVYGSDLWRGRRLETAMHLLFSVVWVALTTLFGACGAWQVGWLR